MKKIFSLLAALIVLSTSGVWAQDASTSTTTKKVQGISPNATAAAELESGYYLVKFQCKPLNSQTNKSAYVFYKGNDVDGAASSVLCANDVSSVDTDTISSSGSLAYVWYVSKLTDYSGNNILTIQCAGNGGFFPKQNGHGGMMNQSKNFANVGTLCYSDVKTNEDNTLSGVQLYQSNCSLNGVPYYVHANNANAPYVLNYWEGAASATACLFSFYKVTLADDVETQATPVLYAKYKQQINGADTGEEVTDYTTLVKKGDTPVNPFLFSSELYDVTYSPTTITSSTDVVTVNFTSKTNSYCRPDTYYKLKVRGNDRSVYAFGTQAQDVEISQNNFGLNYSPERYWRFEQEGLGVKMQCLNGKYIKVSTPSADGATVKAELVDNKADASTFYMEGKPSKSGTPQGFSLKYAANTYLGDHSSNNLGVWRNSDSNALASQDKGSCFVIESNLNDDYETAKNLLSTRLNNMTQPSAVAANMLRVATTEQIESAKAALEVATDMQGVVAAYNKAFTATPDVNAYYRIKCINNINKRYPSSEDIVVGTDGSLATYYNAASNNNTVNRTIARKTESDLLIPQLWQFVSQGDGTYKIKNANNSCCWANATSSIDMPINNADGGNYRIVALPKKSQLGTNASMTELNDGVTTFQLLLGGNVINANQGDQKTDLVAWNNHDEDKANYWQIEKIENFDVTITNAQYATVGYPFAVKVTSDNVKVYYATEAKNGILKLTEATDNIIPANEGAILYCESGETTAKMKILASTNVTFAGNKLTATTAKREGFTTLTTYGLSKVNDVVCFRKNKSTDVPANKAYLDASKYTSASGSAQQLLFSFDNVVEGIDNVVKVQNANKVYYDLQGRRVLYPAHGIFVTENGEKVFIK